MKIKADYLRIRNVPFDEAGNPIEPEQQPVQREMVLDVNVNGSLTGQHLGQVPGQIIVENATVDDYVAMSRWKCKGCKNFDMPAWKKLMRAWEDPTAPMEQRKYLNGVRAALHESGNASIVERHNDGSGELDVDHALKTLGICRPMSEIHQAPIIVYPMSCCPADVCTPTQPQGLYVPKDRESERQGSEAFDKLMRAAQGRST